MAAMIGRRVRLKKGTSTAAVGIVGAQGDDVTIANGEVDITDKDDNGYLPNEVDSSRCAQC